MDQLRGCPQPQIHITRICLKAKSYKNSATLPDCVGKKASTVKRHIPFASWVTDSWKEQCKKLSDYAIRHQSTLTHEALYAVDSEIYQWLCSYKDLTDTDMSFEEWRKRHPETFPKLLKYDQTNKLMDYLDKALEGTPLSLSWHKIPDKPVTINSKTSELSDCEIFPFEEATPVDNFLELNNKELTAMSKQEMTTQLQACQSYIRQQASRILNLYHDYDVEYDTPLSDQDNQPTRKRQRRPSNNERQVATKKRCKQLEGVAARFVYIKSMVEKQHSGGIHCLCKEITSIIKDEKKFSENDTGMPSQVYPPKQITTISTQTETTPPEKKKNTAGATPASKKETSDLRPQPDPVQLHSVVYVQHTPETKDIHFWNTLKDSTKISGKNWEEYIQNFKPLDEKTLQVLGKFHLNSMQFSSGERTLLNYCSTLVNLPQFVNEQAIGLKLTIHLLKAKGFLNSEIAEVFNLMSTKDKRRWNDGTITFIAEKELTNKKLGTHCRPKEQIKVT